jgi:hypothetical protein
VAAAAETGRTDTGQVCTISAKRQRYSLRARLRSVSIDRRARCCGIVSIDGQGPSIIASGEPGRWRAHWRGVLSCGRIWTCPVCSAKLRAQRTARVIRAMRALRGRWQMVTLTVRHRAGDDLGSMIGGMMRALARMRRVRAIGAIWRAHVTASVRATEITHGPHGWHPHIHLLLRVDRLEAGDRAAIARAWRRAVERELGASHVPSARRGVRWSRACYVDRASPDRLAGYVAGLGCEIVGEAKRAARGHASAWEIAERATRRADDRAAWKAWYEFQVATRGRRMIEMDDRARAAAGDDPVDAVEGDVYEAFVSRDELWAIRWAELQDPCACLRPIEAAEHADRDPVDAVYSVLAAMVAAAPAPPERATYGPLAS